MSNKSFLNVCEPGGYGELRSPGSRLPVSTRMTAVPSAAHTHMSGWESLAATLPARAYRCCGWRLLLTVPCRTSTLWGLCPTVDLTHGLPGGWTPPGLSCAPQVGFLNSEFAAAPSLFPMAAT